MKTINAIISAIAVLLLASIASAETPPSTCAELVRASSWDSAVPACTEELRSARDKQRAGLLIMRAGAYMMTSKHKEAVADLTEAIDIEPSFAPAYIARAASFIELGDCKRAVPDLTNAIQLQPGVAGAYAYRAACEFRMAEYDAAGLDATRSLDLTPNTLAFNIRAGVSAHAKDYAGAAAALEESLKLDPKAPGTAYNLSCAYALLGRKDEACQWLARSISLGFKDRAHIEKDTDLDSIRGSACFKKALAPLDGKH